jgi:hypothetical protein
LYHGLLPNATLGLSGGVDENGLLRDPWNNPYRYSVAVQTPNLSRYTGTTGITNIFNDAANQVVNNTGSMLTVCDISTCAGATMIDVAPAIVISMGKNWAGIATASADELANASGTVLNTTYSVSNTNTFVVAGYSEINFDDMLTWISPHLLFSKLISAGQLP